MTRSDHGIGRDEKGQQQPAHGADPKKRIAREATRDPGLNDPAKTPGSGMTPDDQGDAPTG